MLSSKLVPLFALLCTGLVQGQLTPDLAENEIKLRRTIGSHRKWREFFLA